MTGLKIPTAATTKTTRKTIIVDGVVRDVSIPWRGVVKMGPDLAKQLWEMKEGNPRKFSKRYAVQYGDLLRTGAWGSIYSSDILVTSNAILGDGQHRVGGVLLTGIPMGVTLVLGVDPAVLPYVDCGKNRGLSIRCRTDHRDRVNKYTSSIVSVMVKLVTSDANVSPMDVQQMMHEYGDSIVAVGERLSKIGSVAGLRRSGPAAALVQYHDDNYEMADAFMDSYFFAGGPIQPACMLRDFVVTTTHKSSGSLAVRDAYERACSAIAAHIRGDTIRHLKRSGTHPCGAMRFQRVRSANIDWGFLAKGE